jgi:hypothetical protein
VVADGVGVAALDERLPDRPSMLRRAGDDDRPEVVLGRAELLEDAPDRERAERELRH